MLVLITNSGGCDSMVVVGIFKGIVYLLEGAPCPEGLTCFTFLSSPKERLRKGQFV